MVLADWSRTGVAYEEFQSQVFVRGTLLSPIFSQAKAREMARRSGLSGNESAELATRLVAQAKARVRFFVAISTRDPYWNDLDQKKPTLRTRLYATDGQRAMEPSKITRLTDDEMSDMRPFFTYADRLTTGYILEFKAPDLRDNLRLTISGAPGLAELTWRLKP